MLGVKCAECGSKLTNTVDGKYFECLDCGHKFFKSWTPLGAKGQELERTKDLLQKMIDSKKLEND